MRNVANCFPSIDQNNLTTIILSAGQGRRLRSIGPKSLLQLEDITLIDHQITSIYRRFPSLRDFIVATGYECDKLCRALPRHVRVVENENYATTNNVRSLSLALRATVTNSVLVILGDIFFEATALRFDHRSALLIDANGNIEQNKVGVTIQDGSISHLAYGLTKKWAGIGMFHGAELELLRRFCYDRNNSSMCLFEAINFVICKGGNFVPVENCARLREINSIKDLEI